MNVNKNSQSLTKTKTVKMFHQIHFNNVYSVGKQNEREQGFNHSFYPCSLSLLMNIILPIIVSILMVLHIINTIKGVL